MSKIVYYRDTHDVFNIGESGGISYYIVESDKEPKKFVKLICNRNKVFNSNFEEHDETSIVLLSRNILNVIGKVGQLGEGFKQSLYVKNTDHGEKSIASQLGFKRQVFTNEQERGEKVKHDGYVEVMQGENVVGYKKISQLLTQINLDKYKCIQSCMPVQGSSSPFDVLNNKALGSNLVMINRPNQVPKGSFQVLRFFDTMDEALSFKSYINSKLMSFLQFIGLCGATMTSEFFRFIPDPIKFDHIFTDEELYDKYALTQDEIKIVESVIKERK